MSRIGKRPIPVPSGVTVDIKGRRVTVKGPKGALECEVLSDIEVVMEDNVVTVNNRLESKKVSAFRGLTRSLINNMIIGVEEGFTKNLIIEGVGYKANVQGADLVLNIGYSNPVSFPVPRGVNIAVEGNNKIILESADKELLGLTAAKIRNLRKPEPFKGKGIRYEGEHIIRKVGKSGVAK